jgi:alcohol dehydrogenase class IV
MECFEYNANPSRVIFGAGSISKLPAELARLEKKAAVVFTTKFQKHLVDDVRAVLGDSVAAEFTEAAMHTPVDVTERAVKHAASNGADSIISIGGGSTIGLGKAVSIRTGLPHICIATTYAGSEMTPILGETADGIKQTRTDPNILPGTVIYDVNFTLTLPPEMSATSGINAIAHAGRRYIQIGRTKLTNL